MFRSIAIPRLADGQTTAQKILRRRWLELSGLYFSVGLFLAIVIGYKEGVREGINPILHSARMILNGGMAHSYWYVPFFLLLMTLTPVHVWFCRQRVYFQAGLIAVGLVVSALIHRPDAYATFGAVHSVLYYIAVFWIGLMLGTNIIGLLGWLRNKEFPLLVAIACVVAVQISIGQDQVYLTSLGERWGEVDLFVIQKILFGLLFLSLFDRTKHLNMPLIDWISQHSLTIFFMHSPILIMTMWFPHVTGFYVPELVALTAILIIAGLQLHKALERLFYRFLPSVFAIWDRVRLSAKSPS